MTGYMAVGIDLPRGNGANGVLKRVLVRGKQSSAPGSPHQHPLPCSHPCSASLPYRGCRCQPGRCGSISLPTLPLSCSQKTSDPQVSPRSLPATATRGTQHALPGSPHCLGGTCRAQRHSQQTREPSSATVAAWSQGTAVASTCCPVHTEQQD